MARRASRSKPDSPRIDKVEITTDTLTGRGGLAIFVRYLREMGLAPHLERLFGGLRKSRKGLPVAELFKQLFCFFVDGSSRHLRHFDHLKEDAGYAAAIETVPEGMASSHTMKRFLGRFSGQRTWLFRRLLQQLFLWRLKLAQPAVIVLGLDTMVLDNDDAERRHGVEPTYRGVKGFQPLHLTWGRFIIDVVFRGGSKHSNHGETAARMIRHIVRLIRWRYRLNVPIIVRYDSGFFDQELFRLCEELGIGYVGVGKLYDDLTAHVAGLDPAAWRRYQNREQAWDYVEFLDRRGSWRRSRRALYCRPHYDGDQLLLACERPETVLYTNLGQGQVVDALLKDAGRASWTAAERVIELAHGRGADELVHRALKDFGSETLPFLRFAPNAAFYATMLVAFTLYEAFKEDVTAPVVPVTAYPTTLRRTLIDIAAKIVRTGGQTILKVTQAAWRRLRIADLWRRSGCPPRFAWTT